MRLRTKPISNPSGIVLVTPLACAKFWDEQIHCRPAYYRAHPEVGSPLQVLVVGCGSSYIDNEFRKLNEKLFRSPGYLQNSQGVGITLTNIRGLNVLVGFVQHLQSPTVLIF